MVKQYFEQYNGANVSFKANTYKYKALFILAIFVFAFYGYFSKQVFFAEANDEIANSQWIDSTGDGLSTPACGASVESTTCVAGTPRVTFTWNNYGQPPSGPDCLRAKIEVNGSIVASNLPCDGGTYDWATTGGTYNYEIRYDEVVFAKGRTIDTNGNNGNHTAIGGTSDGRNYFIAYRDETSNELEFAQSNDAGATWSLSSGPIDTAGDVGSNVSLHATDANNIYIAYYRSGTGDLKFAKSTDGGAGWTVRTVTSNGNIGKYTSIDVVGNNVFIAYRDEGNNQLMFVKSVDGGVTWPSVTAATGASCATGCRKVIDTAGNVGRFASLDALTANTIYISYYDDANNQLKFAKSTDGGTIWITRIPDTNGNVGMYSSVKGSGPYVYISYQNVTNNRLYFIKSDDGGDTWPAANIKIVDSQANTGTNSSIGVAGSTIYISYYYGGTNKDLKFAKSTDGGASWSNGVIDDVGKTGIATSIYVSDANTIGISYYDVTHTNLKFTRSADGGATWGDTFYSIPGTGHLISGGPVVVPPCALVVDAGADKTVPVSGTVGFADSSIIGGTEPYSQLWSCTGAGSLDNNTLLHPIYTAPLAPEVAVCTLNVTDNASANASDALNVNVVSIGSANLISKIPDGLGRSVVGNVISGNNIQFAGVIRNTEITDSAPSTARICIDSGNEDNCYSSGIGSLGDFPIGPLKNSVNGGYSANLISNSWTLPPGAGQHAYYLCADVTNTNNEGANDGYSNNCISWSFRAFQCGNGVDDSDPEDTLIDCADSGCHSDGNVGNPASCTVFEQTNDDDEGAFICSDGQDNDCDGFCDWNGCTVPDGACGLPGPRVLPADGACTYPQGTVEITQCQDTADNDDDGASKIDTTDPGCHTDGNPNNPATYDPNDNDERDQTYRDIFLPFTKPFASLFRFW